MKQFLLNINRIGDSNQSLIEIFKWFVIKEKSIYSELNKLKVSDKILMGLFWCPTKYRQELDEKVFKIRAKGSVDGP